MGIWARNSVGIWCSGADPSGRVAAHNPIGFYRHDIWARGVPKDARLGGLSASTWTPHNLASLGTRRAQIPTQTTARILQSRAVNTGGGL